MVYQDNFNLPVLVSPRPYRRSTSHRGGGGSSGSGGGSGSGSGSRSGSGSGSGGERFRHPQTEPKQFRASRMSRLHPSLWQKRRSAPAVWG